jgi:hypothetical protein
MIKLYHGSIFTGLGHLEPRPRVDKFRGMVSSELSRLEQKAVYYQIYV